MNIYIGSDHNANEVKKAIIAHLVQKGHNVKNLGMDGNVKEVQIRFATAVANETVKDPSSLGIVLCATGGTVSIAANKVEGARCALAWDETLSTVARKWNNANILALPASYVALPRLIDMVESFLATKWEHEGKAVLPPPEEV